MCKSSNIVGYFEDSFGNSRPLNFHVNSKIGLSIATENLLEF